jgi:hypothetical protein
LGNGYTALLSDGVYSLLLKAAKQFSLLRNKRNEDDSFSNFEGDLVVDSFESNNEWATRDSNPRPTA